MSKLIDLTGKKFGRLTVIERGGNTKKGEATWHCLCDCGKQTVVRGTSLRHGVTNSCGCLVREIAAKIGKSTATHGLRNTRIYRIWSHMKERCTNPKDHRFVYYGGRGITVCEEWQRFEPFYEWAMANGYRDDLTIDRIDVNGPYSPTNCRWATPKEQSHNKRNNRLIAYNGKTQTVTELAEKTGVNLTTIRYRLSRGWSIEKALTTPVDKRFSPKK